MSTDTASILIVAVPVLLVCAYLLLTRDVTDEVKALTIERLGPADRLDGVDWEPSDESWFHVQFRGKRPITGEPAGLDMPLVPQLITAFTRMECEDLRLKVARLERQLQRSRTRHKKASLLVRDLRRAIATLQLEEVSKAHRASQWADFFGRMFPKRREAA